MSALRAAVDYALSVRHAVISEDGTREIVIVPILEALGYFPEGVYSAVRGISFAASAFNASIEGFRNHIYPDLVLTVNSRRVWIIEVKRPESSLSALQTIAQLTAYLKSPDAQCRYGVLTDGFLWKFMKYDGAKASLLAALDIASFHNDASSAAAFRQLMSPSESYLRGMDEDDVLEMYNGGNWITRSICMDWLGKRPLQRRTTFLSRLSEFYAGSTTRLRALPSIMFSDIDDVFSDVMRRSQEDKTDTVRDNAYTIVRNRVAQSHVVPRLELKRMAPQGWFSKVLFVQMLAVVKMHGASAISGEASRIISTLRGDGDPLVREFAELADRGVYTPFPFTALTHRGRAGERQAAIDGLLIAATLRVSQDEDYASESRQSAVDAIRNRRIDDAYLLRVTRRHRVPTGDLPPLESPLGG